MNRYGKSEAKRFNFIDVLIILLLVLIIVGVIFRAQIITFFGDGERRRQCVIEFRADAVPQETVGYVKTGKMYTWVEKDVSLGYLKSVRVSPAVNYIQNPDGTYKTATDPSSYAINGSISAEVLYDDGCYVGGSAFLAPGMELTIHSEDAEFKLIVTAITYDRPLVSE